MKRLLLACLLASACRRDEPKPPPPRPAARHVLRVTKTAGDTQLAVGALAPSGPLTLGAGATLTIAIDDGVRVELRGPGRFQVDGEQLLAGAGLVSVDVAAQAVRSGQRAFSVATPAGQLEVPFAARLVLRAEGAAELALISGEALADGSLPVGVHTRVCFAAVGPHVLSAPGFATVEAALEALPSSHACDDDQAPELGKLDQELAQQLELFTRSKAEQDALIASRAHAQNDDGRRLVQDLAALGQRSLAARTRVLAVRAQLAAAQLGAANDPARAALLTRASELENPAH